MTEEPTDGWSPVAQHEEAGQSPAEDAVSRGDLDEFATTGLIYRVDDREDDDSEALAAARRFDDVVTEQLAPEPSE